MIIQPNRNYYKFMNKHMNSKEIIDMKKMICMALCLSILLTALVGISAASAGSVQPNVSRTGVTVKASVTAEAKAGKYAWAEVSLKITFVRGCGLSNEGQRYPRSDSSNSSSNDPGESKTVTARVKCDNPRDEIGSQSATGKTDWTSSKK